MKKITVISCLILLTTSVLGQDSTTEFGIKGGINYSKHTPNIEVNGVEALDFNRKIGFYVGGYANFEISDILKLQPELLFALQGTNTSTEIEIRESADQAPMLAEFKTSVTESTISLPIMLQLYPSENFYFEIGPQLGYIVSRKDKFTENPFSEPGMPLGISEGCPSCDKFDFGAALGIGYNFTNQIGINARYFAGLIERNNTIKSSVINLGVNYKL